MRTLFKYELNSQLIGSDKIGQLIMPLDARFVGSAMVPRTPMKQNLELFVFCEIDEAQPPAVYPYRLVGNGTRVPEDPYKHHGIFFDGPFVWHLYLDMNGQPQGEIKPAPGPAQAPQGESPPGDAPAGGPPETLHN